MQKLEIIQQSDAHLKFRRSTLVPDEQQVAGAVEDDLLLEPAALGALLLHVGTRQVPMNQGRLPGAHRPDDAQPQVRHVSRQGPFLRVHETICKFK